MAADWSPVWLALRAAALATVLALALGPWLAFLSRRHPAAPLVRLPLGVSSSLLIAYCLLAADFRWVLAALVASAFSLPYLMRASAAAYDSFRPEYLNAARGLGASEWRVFWRIARPLALRPVLSAASFVLASAAAECGVALILARSLRTSTPPPAAPLAGIVAIALAMHYLGIRLDRGSHGL